MRRPGAIPIPALLAVVLLVVLSGCRVPEAVRPTEREPTPVEGERTVPLDVIQGPDGGPWP